MKILKLVFSLSLMASSLCAATPGVTTPSVTISAKTPGQIAKSISETMNTFETYEKFWKTVKVKDTEAYSTLSEFLYRHGKEKIPSAIASGNVVYFFNGQIGVGKSLSQIKIVNAQPLEIAIDGKTHRIQSVADAIRLLEPPKAKMKSEARATLWPSLIPSLLFSQAFAGPVGDAINMALGGHPAPVPAAGVAGAAAPASAAVAAVAAAVPVTVIAPLSPPATAAAVPSGFRKGRSPVIPVEGVSRVEPNFVFDEKQRISGHVIVDNMSLLHQILSCEKFMGGEETLMPAVGGRVALSYQRPQKPHDKIESFIFPDMNGDRVVYRRGTTLDTDRNVMDIWGICKSKDCQEIVPFTKEKLVSEGGGFGKETSTEIAKVLGDFETLKTAYRKAAEAYKQNAPSGNSETQISTLATTSKAKHSVQDLAKAVTSPEKWPETAKSLKAVVAKTQKAGDKTMPPITYSNEQLKNNLTCLIYERFQENKLFENCDKEDIKAFKDNITIDTAEAVIDAAAAAMRPLKVPEIPGTVVSNSLPALYFLDAALAKKVYPSLRASLDINDACTKLEQFAKDYEISITKGTSEAQCLDADAYTKRLNIVGTQLAGKAAEKINKRFEAGPLAAANFAGAVAQCCLSTPCKDGIDEANQLSAGTFKTKATADLLRKSPSREKKAQK